MANTHGCRSRFTRPVFLWAIAAEVALLGERIAKPQPSPLLALLPLVPALVFIGALVAVIQKMDELQKRICLDSIFFAFMATLALAFIADALAEAGIYRAPWQGPGTVMLFLWGCAYVFSAWRYR